MKNTEKHPLVSVIIVNFNGKNHLKKCINSLRKQQYRHIEIIFVDNGSHDGSVEFVRQKFPEVVTVSLSRNIGFAGGNNAGLSSAHGEYILLLNNDTMATSTCISNLVRVFLRDKAIGAAQSKLLMMDNPGYLDSVGAYLTPTGFLYHYGYAKKNGTFYNKQLLTYSAKGACLMIRKKTLDAVLVNSEMFDSDYFAYFEETDLCHRVWLSGYKVVFVPSSIVYHKMGATSGQMDNSFVQYHSFKNRINSYIKNLGAFKLISILPIHLFICMLYSLFCVIKNKGRIALAIYRAIFWNISILPKTLNKRAYIQKTIRTRSDNEFWPQIMRHPHLKYYYLMTVGVENYIDE
ncbi:MAG: glycosyltransferase family 2 protein [Patescibacteria group bacterium]